MKVSERLSKLAKGYVKRIHVDKKIIGANLKHGTNDPALTVQTSAGSLKGRQVDIIVDGKVVASLVYPEKPLSCGARVWIETTEEVHIEVC